MKNRRNVCLIITAILFCIAVMVSCTNKKGQDIIVPEVSFSKDLIPVLQADCAIDGGCHSGAKNTGDNIDLDSSVAYNTIISKDLITFNNLPASLLYVEISSGTMPKAPYDNMSSVNKSLILNWVTQGAKNN